MCFACSSKLSRVTASLHATKVTNTHEERHRTVMYDQCINTHENCLKTKLVISSIIRSYVTSKLQHSHHLKQVSPPKARYVLPGWQNCDTSITKYLTVDKTGITRSWHRVCSLSLPRPPARPHRTHRSEQASRSASPLFGKTVIEHVPLPSNTRQEVSSSQTSSSSKLMEAYRGKQARASHLPLKRAKQ